MVLKRRRTTTSVFASSSMFTNKLNFQHSTLTFSYKQPVYKQLALGQKIAKHLPGFNLFHKATIKTTNMRKVESFLCNTRIIAVKPRTHQNSAVQKALLEKFIITDHKYQFSVLKITVLLAGIGYLVELLSNH